jgi:hypothetical protein
MNTSSLPDDETAQTDPECTRQRAEHLAILGAHNVLELCVGPSLRALDTAYRAHWISVVGNDIDPRWRRAYPDGSWLIGDALTVDWSQFDTVVFAPPLTVGCTGRREDALPISRITPSYREFLARPFDGLRVMVLPARAIATPADRREFYELIAMIDGPCDVIALTAGARRIRKYVDVYFRTGVIAKEER